MAGWDGDSPENPVAKEARKGRSPRKTPRLSLTGVSVGLRCELSGDPGLFVATEQAGLKGEPPWA